MISGRFRPSCMAFVSPIACLERSKEVRANFARGAQEGSEKGREKKGRNDSSNDQIEDRNEEKSISGIKGTSLNWSKGQR